MGRKAIYAGSFDLVTKGHLWVIHQASRIFDEVVVAIGENPTKKYTFELEERMALLKESVKDFPNVTVVYFSSKYLVHFAKSIGAQFVIRGIRNEKDYNDERDMRYINSDLNSAVETVFLIPPKHLSEVSSSLLKQLIGPQGWEKAIQPYVSECVYKRLLNYGLYQEFESVWTRLSSDPALAKKTASTVLDDLITHYMEGHRHYHNLSHILDCLEELNAQTYEADDYSKLALAIWFHDVIYDTKAKDNELKSSELFDKHALGSKLDSAAISEVKKMILATQTHVGENPLEQTMLDIDLSILGRSEEDFNLYDSNIRKEYHWVPEESYGPARNKIMAEFGNRDRIFKSEHFYKKYETQAKENLRRFKQ